jgi:DNA polymerase-2
VKKVSIESGIIYTAVYINSFVMPFSSILLIIMRNSSDSSLKNSSAGSLLEKGLASNQAGNSVLQQEINQGFILTRQSQDRFGRICITLWLKTASGPVKLEILDELAVFFVCNTQQKEAINVLNEASIKIEKVKPLTLKTFNQEFVSGFYFKSMRDFYAARDRLKHHSIKC